RDQQAAAQGHAAVHEGRARDAARQGLTPRAAQAANTLVQLSSLKPTTSVRPSRMAGARRLPVGPMRLSYRTFSTGGSWRRLNSTVAAPLLAMIWCVPRRVCAICGLPTFTLPASTVSRTVM